MALQFHRKSIWILQYIFIWNSDIKIFHHFGLPPGCSPWTKKMNFFENMQFDFYRIHEFHKPFGRFWVQMPTPRYPKCENHSFSWIKCFKKEFNMNKKMEIEPMRVLIFIDFMVFISVLQCFGLRCQNQHLEESALAKSLLMSHLSLDLSPLIPEWPREPGHWPGTS